MSLALVGSAVVFPLALVYLVNPSGSTAYPPCPFHALTGLYCPGCGSLRAIHQLLHGHVGAALRLNILMVMLLPYVAYGMATEVKRLLGERLLPALPGAAYWARTLLVIVIAYWILRNMPVYPFMLLAPG